MCEIIKFLRVRAAWAQNPKQLGGQTRKRQAGDCALNPLPQTTDNCNK